MSWPVFGLGAARLARFIHRVIHEALLSLWTQRSPCCSGVWSADSSSGGWHWSKLTRLWVFNPPSFFFFFLPRLCQLPLKQTVATKVVQRLEERGGWLESRWNWGWLQKWWGFEKWCWSLHVSLSLVFFLTDPWNTFLLSSRFMVIVLLPPMNPLKHSLWADHLLLGD